MLDRIRSVLESHTKAHHLSLLVAACSFARCAWVCTDAAVVAAVGATFSAIYGANAWAGTKTNGAHAPLEPSGPAK